MGRTHTLKNLAISEISLVDSPANPHALHVLFKRQEDKVADSKKTTEGPLERLLTRLGLSKRQSDVDPAEHVSATLGLIDQGSEALSKSVDAIFADPRVSDKAAAIGRSVDEFAEYLGDAVPGQIEKAMREVAVAVEKGTQSMATVDEMQAQIADLSKQLADSTEALAKAAMSDKHKAAYEAMSDAQKKTFLAASAAERDGMCKAAAPALDGPLLKALEETADLKKRLAVMEAERDLDDCRKRAIEAGLPPDQAGLVQKARQGEAGAIDQILGLLKAANAQASAGVVFKEFGSTAPTAGSAASEVQARAEEMRKSNVALSIQAARSEIRKLDPSLAQRERDEERRGNRDAA